MKSEERRGDYPIRLTCARAWRTYLGGRLIDGLHGVEGGEDGHFPEEWIASLVSARNAGREEIEEGQSRLAADPSLTLKDVIESAPEVCLGAEHVKKYGSSAGVLVKLIDAAERLTVQVHPDREQARRLFHSQYGKTECWHILGGREIAGEKPCVYLGFREGVTREAWQELFRRQDAEGMLACLHRFDVKPGDTVFIEGGVPHAIGAGCFLIEIQEPTDYTIRVERTTPSGFAVDDFMCHQGLGFDKMFDCFRYGGLSAEETRRRWFIEPREKETTAEGRVISLIGPPHTSYFAMDRIEVKGELVIEMPAAAASFEAVAAASSAALPKASSAAAPAAVSNAAPNDLPNAAPNDPPKAAPVFSGLYILAGEGELGSEKDGKLVWQPVRQGEQFFLPAACKALRLRAGEGAVHSCPGPGHGPGLRAIRFFGPR